MENYIKFQTEIYHLHVRFEVLTAVTTESTAFRDKTPCNPIQIYRYFRNCGATLHWAEASKWRQHIHAKGQ
jgi:hypothetical protein